MTWHVSVAVRNAMMNAFESTAGPNAIWRFYSGSEPASAAVAATGTLLAEAVCGTDWMGNASAGVAALLSSIQDASANASGTLGYFRVYDSTGTTCHGQGKCGVTGDATAQMTFSSLTVTAGQPLTVNSFSITGPNA